MKSEEKQSFICYHSFFSQFKLLDMEERGQLITAIFQYATEGHVDGLPRIIEMAFSGIKDTLDRDRESYEETCRRRAENGKKGGRPKKQSQPPDDAESETSQKTNCFSEKPKKADNDTDTENDTENDTGTGTENDTDTGNENENENDVPYGTEVGDVPSYERVPPIGSAAPPQNKIDFDFLETRGLPRSYIEERRERAILYARRQGGSPESVLLSWWEEDKRRRRPPREKEEVRATSFDVDDFFEAALMRGLRD